MQHLKNKIFYFFLKRRGKNGGIMGLFTVKKIIVYTEKKLLRFN